MIKQLFQKKPLQMYEEEISKSELRRVHTKWDLTLLGIGAIIGAGIFVMTGLGAKEYAGPALALSFILAGLGCTFAALCYAEFATILPVEGSVYSYSYASIGELFAWIIGWDLILEYAMASSTVAVGWSGYMGKFLGLFNLHFPIWLMNDLYTAKHLISDAVSRNSLPELAAHYSSLDIPVIGGWQVAFNFPALLIMVVITTILVRGIRESSRTNALMVTIKVTVVLFVIFVGAFYISFENWNPFIPQPALNSQGNVSYGYMGIVSAAAYVFFAYIGFDAVSTQAGESLNPKKDIPFGIIVSLVLCTILYVLVALVLTGMVPYKEIDITAPISAAFGRYGLNFAVWIISIAAVAGLTSVLLVMMLGQTRVFYAMAKDGLLPKKVFQTIHPKFKTPYISTIVTGIGVTTVAALTPIETIAKLVNIGTLLAFVLVCAAVWYMRYKEPHRERSFKVPYLPVVASLGIAFNLGMMFGLEWQNWMRLFAWLGIGLVIYFLYSRKRSKVSEFYKNQEKPDSAINLKA